MHHCPTWQWASGDDSKAKSYLPKNKQFLITRNVPCSRRCKQIEYSEEKEKIVESDDADNGWVDTHHFDPSILEEKVSEMNLENHLEGSQVEKFKISDKSSNSAISKVNEDYCDDDDDDEACDMDEFEKEGFPIDDNEVNLNKCLSV